jgi:hypothetical protein
VSATLPRNLALVGEDLARATQRDAQRSARRRRYAIAVVVLGLLAVTGTAAIANGWLFGREAALEAAPGLVGGDSDASRVPSEVIAAANELSRSETQHQAEHPDANQPPPMGSVDPGAARTLLTGLGGDERVLTSIPTKSGGVCLALTGLAPQCPPTFPAGREIIFYFATPHAGTTVIWGIARDEVTAVDAVTADGTTTRARFAHNAFYVELTDARPVRLVAHLQDGSSDSEAVHACPLSTPNCTP